jgi:hypothetical protein
MATIQIKRGAKTNLPASLLAGEPAFTTDTSELYVGTGSSRVKVGGPMGTAAAADTGTSAGNVPVLDASGKLNANILPGLALTDVFTAGSQAAMLALSAEQGDVAIRTDESKTYVLAASPASTLSNWKQLLFPGVDLIDGGTF